MFSGLIAHRARVAAIAADPRGGVRLRVEAPDAIAEGVEPKDSIAINGVCLTAVAVGPREIEFDVVPETLQRSSLGSLQPAQVVNLELSLRLGDRLGGHFVYGHVDATVLIESVVAQGQGVRMRIGLPVALRRFVVEKGYVALDGVSLTVASADRDAFEIALIPETLERTTLGRRGAGDRLNLEIDPIARYAVAALSPA